MRTHNFQSCHHSMATAAVSMFLLVFCARHSLCCTPVQNASACAEGTFRDSRGCCQQCTTCNEGRMYVKSECNKTHDAVCDCRRPQYLLPGVGCVIDCRLCKTGECKPGTRQCLCPACYSEDDRYCDGGPTNCASEYRADPATTRRMIAFPDETSFPAWGIGLVATGVVIGIIVFASCFLCLGLVTVTRQRETESQNSDNSESGLVVRGSFSSIGTESSFLSNGYPYLTSHSMLELLKNSNSNSQLLSHTSKNHLGTGGGPPTSSSQRSSPVSIRDSPRPVRTIKLVKQADKLSTVII